MKIHNIKSIFKLIFGYRRLWLVVSLPLALLLIFIAKSSTNFAEWYAQNIYKYLSLFWNNVSGILPFSLTEIIIILLPFCAISYIVYGIVRIIKKRGKRLRTLYELFINIICVSSVITLLFTTNCGINYYRKTFSELNGFETREYSSETLYKLCIFLGENLNNTRKNVSERDGIMCLNTGEPSALEKSAIAMNSLSEKYKFINSGYSNPKGVMLSHLMSYTNITGVFFPFTFEANVNVDIPEYSIPSTMCHELTHLSGFMREDEANFTAFLACIESDYTDFRYSGYMLAYIYASNALFSTDTDKYLQACVCITDDVKNDIAAGSEYWRQFETPVAQTASSINDSYLKSNSQSDGVKSYGRMIDLLVAYYKL